MSGPIPAVLGRWLLTIMVLIAVLAFAVGGSEGGASGAILKGYGSSEQGKGPARQADPGASPNVSAAAFSISGSVKGFYPGKSLSLVLIVSNPQTAAITVTSITTTVGAASSSCGASNVTVSSFAGNLLVPAGGKAKATVHASMTKSAPNACEGKVFPFHYAGSGAEA
jgi:hypothetical protein